MQIFLLAVAGTLQAGSSVAIAEVVDEGRRPIAQSWFGLVGALVIVAGSTMTALGSQADENEPVALD